MRLYWRRLPVVAIMAIAVSLIGPYYVGREIWRAGWKILTMPEELYERRRLRW